MVEITFTCSMCGKSRTESAGHAADADKTLRQIVGELYNRDFRPWYAQVNGEHFDTYCSSECAR